MPKLSDEARRRGLERSRAAKARRREVRGRLRAGELTVADVLRMALDDEDEALLNLRLTQLVTAAARCSQAEAEALLERGRIVTPRVRGLGSAQIRWLVRRLDGQR